LEAENRTDEAFEAAIANVEAYKEACDSAAGEVEGATDRMDEAWDRSTEDADNRLGEADDHIRNFADDAVVDLDRIQTEADRTADHFDDMDEHTSSAIDDINQRLHEYRDGVSDSSGATEELRQRMEAWDEEAKHAGETVEDTREHIHNMDEDVGRVSGDFDRLSESIDRSNGHLTAIRNQLAVVGQATDLFVADLMRGAESVDKEGEEAEKTGKKLDNLTNSTNKATKSGKGLHGQAMLITAALIAFAGPIGGLLTLGIPAFFGALGAGAEAVHTKYAQMIASGQKLTATQRALYDASIPLVNGFAVVKNAADGVIQQFAHMITKEAPELREAFDALAPEVQILGGGLIGFTRILISGLAPAVATVQPVVAAFASGLKQLASDLVALLTHIRIDEAVQGIQALFRVLSAVLGIISALLDALMPISNMFLNAASSIIVVVSALVRDLAPALSSVGELFAPLAKMINAVLLALTPLITAVNGAANQLAGLLVPILNKMTPLIGKLSNEIAKVLVQALNSTMEVLTPLLPVLGDLADQILQALIQMLQAAAPAFDSVVKAIGELAPTLPGLVTDVTDLVKSVAPVIVEFIKFAATVTEAVMPAVVAIVGFLIKFFGPAFDAAGHIISDFARDGKEFIQGFIQFAVCLFNLLKDWFSGNWGNLWNDAWVVLQGFGKMFMGIVRQFVQIGVDIVQGLWQGIQQASSWFMSKIGGLGNQIVNAFQGVLHIFSPSQVMADKVGQYIPAGIAQGMLANAHLVTNAARAVANQAVVGAQIGASVGVGLGLNATNSWSSNENNGRPIQFLMQGNQLMSDRDMQVFVDKMGPTLVNMLQRAGVNIRK